MIVEPANADDLSTLLKIEDEAFQSDKVTKRQFVRYLKNNMRTALLLVGRKDYGEPCLGYILVHTQKNKTIGRIHSYAVSSQARGTGLGELLIESACTTVQGFNCRALRTEVRIDNPHALKRYEKSGFTKIGERKVYYSDGCDSFSFERKLA